MGQVCRITDQEGNDEYFYYDEEGRRETHIDRNGNVERTLYNMDGSLCYQRFEDRKGRNPVVNRYTYYPDGKLKEAAGGGIAYHYAYTENGLLKSKSASGRPLFKYAYDSNRNLTSLTDSAGNIVQYSYDVMNRLKKVAGGRDEVLVAYDYDGAGQLRKLRYGNGVQTEYSYQDDGDIASLVTVTEQGQMLLNFDYAYDGNGNCVRKSGEKYQNEYTYDRMNRLVGAVQDGEEEKYAYDLVGNRLKKESVQGTENYHYNAKNQLTHIHNGENTLRYLYDKQGNLLEEQGQTRRKQYSYDAANRQVSIASSKEDGTIGKLLQFNRYDGEGLRYETEENGKIIRFLFDRGELAQENREGEETRYVRGRSPIALSRGGKDRNYFIQDEMGSTLFLLDQDHEIRKSYRYDAFGNILEETGDIPNRLMYTGQMYDGTAVQYYLRARFYNPAIGRFMQEDTYRGDGLNLYAYCANNPVIYYDPSGFALCPKEFTQPGNDKSASERRNSAGTVEGTGRDTKRMMYGSDRNAGVIPSEIADKLRGKTYNNFAEFKADFWKAVADSPYANEFIFNDDYTNLYIMRNGGAPLVMDTQTLDVSVTYQLHHVTPINQGGMVYNLDNIVIVTPRYHAEILIPSYHGYNGFNRFFK